MEEQSSKTIEFAQSAVADRENFLRESLSPYLAYSHCQAGIIQYRLWKQHHDSLYRDRVQSIKFVLKEFSKRWLVAGESCNSLR